MPITKFKITRMTRRAPFVNLSVALIVLSTVAIPSGVAGQTAEPDQTPPSGFPDKRSASGAGIRPNPQPAPAVDRPVSWKLLLPNLISDQERIWSFPARLVQGQNWIPTAAVLGTTAGLLALDPTEAAYFRRTSTFQGSTTFLRATPRSSARSSLRFRFTLSGWSGKTRKCNERRYSRAKPSPTPRS